LDSIELHQKSKYAEIDRKEIKS